MFSLLPAVGCSRDRFGLSPCTLLALLSLTAGLPACSTYLPSHFHSKADEEAVNRARDAIAAQNTAAPGLYTAMRGNLELFAKEENRILMEYADAAANGSYAQDHLSVAQTDISLLTGDGTARSGEIGGFIYETIPAQLATMDAISQSTKKKVGSAEDAIKTLSAAINEKKAEVNAYNSSIALLRTAIIQAPNIKKGTLAAQTDADKLSSLQALGDELGKLADTKVTYVDADGKTQEKSASKVAEENYRWYRKENGKEVTSFKVPGAPGIDLVILNLALDLLQLDRDQAKADLAYLGQMRRVIEDAYSQALLARVLIKDANQPIQDQVGEDVTEVSSKLEADARKMRKVLSEDKKIDIFHNDAWPLLAAVRKVAVAKNSFHRSQALMKVSLARLDHDRSIVQSSFNDSRRRAVITRATAGLQAYHSGGFKAEHAAQILRIAQVVALGSIAHQL